MFLHLTPTVYIQISPQLLTLKNLKTQAVIAEVPEVAISTGPKRIILAVGPEARQAAAMQPAEVVNPFGHPRTLVGDFTLGEQLLKQQLRRLLGNTLFGFSPRIVMHPLGDPEGGFTQIELRALREMALGAGAREVYLRVGAPLTDAEILGGTGWARE